MDDVCHYFVSRVLLMLQRIFIFKHHCLMLTVRLFDLISELTSGTGYPFEKIQASANLFIHF